MEQVENFFKAIYPHVCDNIQRDLKTHFPTLFPKEQPLEPGYYRDREGKIYMLLEIGSRWKLCSPTHTYKCSDHTYLFDNYEPNISRLRDILSQMQRVENP